jgi:thiopurine S-methyltransferase
MEAGFWHERWQENRIGFHQSSVNPHLTTFWNTLAVTGAAPVFVPLCGKSLDMVWLAAQGHPVLGVELSGVAIEGFFREQSLSPEISQTGAFQAWQAGQITLLCGDFFALDQAFLADVRAVYDRASLIALPPAMRRDYVRHFLSIVPAAAVILLITVEYDQTEMAGPPFAVSETEVRQLYEQHYQVELLLNHDALAAEPNFRSRGLTRLAEKIYRLIPRSAG